MAGPAQHRRIKEVGRFGALSSMTNAFAQALMRSPRSRPATYTAPGGSPVPIRCVFEDSSAEARVNSGVDVIADQAEGSVLESVNPQVGGVITAGTAEYEIRNIELSSAPGLLELDLLRTAGDPVEAHNLAPALMAAMTDTVQVDGQPVRARVARRAKVIEGDAWQGRVVTIRTLISAPNADLAAAGPGSFVDLAGRELVVDRVMRDGTGMTILVC